METVRLWGWGPLCETVRAKAFEQLYILGHDIVEHFQGDFYHDARWISEHVDGPTTFYWGCDDSGTCIGYRSPDWDEKILRRYLTRKNLWKITLRCDDAHAPGDGDWVLDIEKVA